MASKTRRQTFEKFKREQAVKERRERKQERRQAARLAKADDAPALDDSVAERAEHAPIA